jgi:hypothetical protein
VYARNSSKVEAIITQGGICNFEKEGNYLVILKLLLGFTSLFGHPQCNNFCGYLAEFRIVGYCSLR